jgi:hypothetical protein
MHTGDGKVRRDAHTRHSDERVAKNRLHLAEENFAQILLYETGDFILSGRLHGGKRE